MLEAIAIVLAVISLIITVVGFFASLKFYRDGVQLQQAANNALTKLEQKTEFIQTQVGGMFDKTLDAAIGKRETLVTHFGELNDQLEKTKAKIIEESISQVGAAGEQERKRLSKLVDSQIALIKDKVRTAEESAVEMVNAEPELPLSARIILKRLAASENGLTVDELAEAGRLSDSLAQRRVIELRNKGYIELREGGRYTLRSKT